MVEELAGRVIVGGFDGKQVPDEIASRLARGHLAGVTLFARNFTDVFEAHAMSRELHRVCRDAGQLPVLLTIDQEGGRVARLKPPFPKLPPMRWFGQQNDIAWTARTAQLLADCLRAVGINLDFAPVADVDSNPANPVIGDRSFSTDPAVVGTHVRAFVSAMQSRGVAACAKHFPGHGDTAQDSHFELPRLTHDRARIDAVELPPFRAAFEAGVATVMTAHVIFDCVDRDLPATLSRRVVTELLRETLGFGRNVPYSVCFSDDLHMKAVADTYGVEEAAIRAIEAGCDALLVCTDPDSQERVRHALDQRAHDDAAFASRLREAVARVDALRATLHASPSASADELRKVLESNEAKEWAAEVERRSRGA